MSVEQVGPGGVSNSYGVRTTTSKVVYENDNSYQDVFIPTGSVPVTATPSGPRPSIQAAGVEIPGTGVSPLLVQASPGAIPTRVSTASSASVCAESRRQCRTGRAALSEIRLAFSGFYILNGSGTETSPGNTQSIQCAIEWPGAPTQVVQVTFNGGNAGTIPDGAAEYLSDPIYPGQFGIKEFPANTYFWYRERRVVAVGHTQTKSQASASTGESTYYSDGLSASQLVATGSMSLPAGGTYSPCEFGPSAFLGRSIGMPDIAVYILGDSLLNGNSDQQLGGIGNNNGGFVMRGLYSVNGRTVPSMKATCGGTQAQYFVSGFLRRRAYLKYCTHAVCNYGSNDAALGSRTAEQAIADLRVLWGVVRGGDSNIRYLGQIGIIPRTTSTDGYATVKNQTPLSRFENGGAFRTVLNDAIKGYVGSEINEYIDISPVFADPLLTDRWKVGATTDGTHYSQGYAALAGSALGAVAATWI